MESIDLTWGGFFGGIGDGTAEAQRRFPEDPLQIQQSIFTWRNPTIDAILGGMTLHQPLLEERTGGEIDEQHILTLIYLFDDLDPTIYQSYDPYSNMGHYCDCCGELLNILTGRYFMCYECDDQLDQDVLHGRQHTVEETISML